MRRTFSRITVAGLAVLVLAACNRNNAQNPTPAPAAEHAAEAPAPPQPPAPPPIPASTELPVNTVDSVMMSRAPDTPAVLVIHVAGTAISAGWTEPRLTPSQETSEDPSVRTYQLVATSPAEMPAERMPQPLEADLNVDDLPPEVKTIRIVAGTNEISAPVAQ